MSFYACKILAKSFSVFLALQLQRDSCQTATVEIRTPTSTPMVVMSGRPSRPTASTASNCAWLAVHVGSNLAESEEMKAFNIASIAAITLLLAGVAHAQSIRITVPKEVQLRVSTVTRAEVLADYHIWRLAGLQVLNQGDIGPNTESAEYRQALAKYEYLRASPEFPGLVAELARRPNTTVLARP